MLWSRVARPTSDREQQLQGDLKRSRNMHLSINKLWYKCQQKILRHLLSYFSFSITQLMKSLPLKDWSTNLGNLKCFATLPLSFLKSMTIFASLSGSQTNPESPTKVSHLASHGNLPIYDRHLAWYLLRVLAELGSGIFGASGPAGFSRTSLSIAWNFASLLIWKLASSK